MEMFQPDGELPAWKGRWEAGNRGLQQGCFDTGEEPGKKNWADAEAEGDMGEPRKMHREQHLQVEVELQYKKEGCRWRRKGAVRAERTFSKKGEH